MTGGESSEPGPHRSTRPRRGLVIVVLILVFLAPLSVAFYIQETHSGQPPSSTRNPGSGCEGGGGTGPFHFVFVGGVGGRLDFNGTVPGPCVLVANGSHVQVTFEVALDAGVNHSWVLVPALASDSALPAFPGAGFSGPSRFVGIAPGAEANFSFQVTQAGSYRYVCEVPGHAEAGMYGWFNVTGTVPPASAGVRHFILIAGENGTLTFNGTVPGPSIQVSQGTHVWITFQVSPEAGISHSWILVNVTNGRANTSGAPVFPGAGTVNPTQGDPPGSTTNLTFVASRAGSYLYICDVPGHYEAGMFGYFNVTGNGTSSSPPPPPPPPSPTVCEGNGTLGAIHLVIIADPNGTSGFNGTTPGPCIEVAQMSWVTVTFRVGAGSPGNHSWDLVDANAPDNATPVFPGAGTAGALRLTGLPAGSVVNYTFQVVRAGSFRYQSEVGNDSLTYWGTFNVTVGYTAFHGRHFIIIAGENDSLTFNGTSPGPTLAVPNGTFVWVTFQVSPQAGISHSWVLVNESSGMANETGAPVFPGASTPDPTVGQSVGSTTQLTFVVDRVGTYLYICEVDGHYTAGMYGDFDVTTA